MPNDGLEYPLKVAREMLDVSARGRLECDEFTGPHSGRNRRTDLVAVCRALIALAAPVPEKNPDTPADSLLAYCRAHPQQRFWQALRNWARVANWLVFSPTEPVAGQIDPV